MSTSKHQVFKKNKGGNQQISFTLGMVSSSLPGLYVPGDKGFKIIVSLWPWVWLAEKSDSLNDFILLEQSTELVLN